jgi:ribose/xylose/arabinose/galactoside ABC-type transport system permease subunit
MIRRLLASDNLVCILCVVWFLAMGWVVEGWLSIRNLSNILITMLPLLVIAIGQMFVMVTAGIDLSVTAIVAMASVVGASVMTASGGPLTDSAFAVPLAVLAMLLVGITVGTINGLSVSRLRMPPFMVTLATQIFFVGAATWYPHWFAGSSSIADLPKAFVALAQEPVPLLPNMLWISLTLAVAAHFVLAKTVLGRSLYAVGINPGVARVSGLRVERTLLLAYIICGFYAAVGAIMYTALQETGDPKLGSLSKLLDVIGAAVIGGTSLSGGKGKVVWTVFGVLLLVLIDTSLAMQGLSEEIVMISKGTVILLAATLDAVRTRSTES